MKKCFLGILSWITVFSYTSVCFSADIPIMHTNSQNFANQFHATMVAERKMTRISQPQRDGLTSDGYHKFVSSFESSDFYGRGLILFDENDLGALYRVTVVVDTRDNTAMENSFHVMHFTFRSCGLTFNEEKALTEQAKSGLGLVWSSRTQRHYFLIVKQMERDPYKMMIGIGAMDSLGG